MTRCQSAAAHIYCLSYSHTRNNMRTRLTQIAVYSLMAALVTSSSIALAQPQSSRKNVEAVIREMEAKWDTAAINNDVKLFNAILADGFISTNPRGEVQTKSQMLDAMKAGNLKFLASKGDDIKVFLYGDAALVSGRWKSKYIENGKNNDVIERYTASYPRQTASGAAYPPTVQRFRIQPGS